MRKDGDPACLQAKALDDATLAGHGSALLQRYGVQMARLMEENFDRSAYQSALFASAGRNVAAEIERLERDPGVKTFKELNRPAHLARAADMLLEQFDRYVLIGRIKLDPISDQSRGGEAGAAGKSRAGCRGGGGEVPRGSIPAVNRYVDMLDAMPSRQGKGIQRPSRIEARAGGLFRRCRARSRRAVHRPPLD